MFLGRTFAGNMEIQQSRFQFGVVFLQYKQWHEKISFKCFIGCRRRVGLSDSSTIESAFEGKRWLVYRQKAFVRRM